MNISKRSVKFVKNCNLKLLVIKILFSYSPLIGIFIRNIERLDILKDYCTSTDVNTSLLFLWFIQKICYNSLLHHKTIYNLHLNTLHTTTTNNKNSSIYQMILPIANLSIRCLSVYTVLFMLLLYNKTVIFIMCVKLYYTYVRGLHTIPSCTEYFISGSHISMSSDCC